MRFLRFVPVALICAALIGCSSDNPTGSNNIATEKIAGGGRQVSSDPFIGGPDESGPMSPDSVLFPPDSVPMQGLMPLFYFDRDCAESPGHRVIHNQEDWEAWWAAAFQCVGTFGQGTIGPEGMHGGMYYYARPGDPHPEPSNTDLFAHWNDSIPGDSGYVWPDSGYVWPDSGQVWPDSGHVWPDSGHVWPDSGHVWPDSGIVDTVINPWPPSEAPPVDFDQFAVVVISLDPDTLFGRSLMVTEVTDDGGGAVVKYTVTHLGDDCLSMTERLTLYADNSPTVAVMVPLPVSEPVSWERSDEIINCTWHPNPNIPQPVYYTDADCDLGPGEEIIRDAETFEAWMTDAMACDSMRWDYLIDTSFMWTDSMGQVIDPHPPHPYWNVPHVDFATQAVIILRAGVQTQWGGGVWLNMYDKGSNGTTIEYTVMEPGGNCPPVAQANQTSINPTVAIRVPLPADGPVVWHRNTQTINCDWPDTVLIDPMGRGGM